MGISDIMRDGDLVARIEQLERQLRDLTSGRRLEDASIGARGIRVIDGGNVTIDGGNLRVISDDAVPVVFFGPVGISGGVGAGWIFSYDSGEPAFYMGGGAGQQFWQLRDQDGADVLSSDALSGHGLSRPYLQMRLVPSLSAEQDGTSFYPSTTNGSATKLMQGVNPIWHPKLSIGVAVAGTGTGTNHWRLDINGVTVIADETDAGAHTVDIPGWGDTIQPGTAVGIDLYGWHTGGVGRCFVQCDRLYGRQS